ncbi:MAG: hypothetical protein QOF28_2305 [Actinomycetota bacterium]|nr:hypothetical protein [Actinomycetota bacterium]
MVKKRSRYAKVASGAFSVWLLAGVLTAALIVTGSERGFAHIPHDQITHVAVSPAFATDHTVYTVSDGEPLRSTDGGRHWVEMVRGLTGEVAAYFAVSPVDPRVVYLATRGGGVYRSGDAGVSWKPTNAARNPANTAELAVSPVSSDVVVAAGGLFGGVYLTVDGGATWRQTPRLGRVNVAAFVAGHTGRVVAGDATGTLLVSDDNGASFRPAGKIPGAAITALAAGPAKAESTLFAATNTGVVFFSDDAGSSWSKVGAGLPDQQILALAFSGNFASDSTLWASTWHHGPYRSTDGGKTWKAQPRGLTTDPQANAFGYPEFHTIAVARNASGKQVLYLVGYDGLFESSDEGAHWASVETVSEYITGLAISPNYANDHTVVVNSYVKGVYISHDDGDTFTSSNRGLEHAISEGNKLLPVKRMHNVVFSPGYATDHTILTATWDKFVKSTDGGKTWKQIVVAPPPPGSKNLRQFVIAVSPQYASDRTVYLGTKQGDIYRSTKGGAPRSWTTAAKLSSRVRSLVVTPSFANDHTLFAGTEKGVFTSADGGATWTPTGPKDIALLAMSANYAGDGTVFAGTEHGLFATRDRGRTWNLVSAAPFSSATKVEALALSPAFGSDRTVLVSVSGVGLFRSTDAGRTFSAVGASLLERNLVIKDFENPTSEPIQFSPTYATDRTVYAFAQQSVVRSRDGGMSWTALDLPPAAAFRGKASATETSTDGGLPVVPIAIAGGLVVVVAAGFAAARRRRSLPTATEP